MMLYESLPISETIGDEIILESVSLDIRDQIFNTTSHLRHYSSLTAHTTHLPRDHSPPPTDQASHIDFNPDFSHNHLEQDHQQRQPHTTGGKSASSDLELAVYVTEDENYAQTDRLNYSNCRNKSNGRMKSKTDENFKSICLEEELLHYKERPSVPEHIRQFNDSEGLEGFLGIRPSGREPKSPLQRGSDEGTNKESLCEIVDKINCLEQELLDQD
jgi:hypothetical protein